MLIAEPINYYPISFQKHTSYEYSTKMSATLNEEPKIVPKATAATELPIEANSNGDSKGPDKSFPEKEISTVADKTKEEPPKIEKNVQEETLVKDPKNKEVQSNKNLALEGVKEKTAEDENGTKAPILEEAFKEEIVEPVESLKDIADSLNAAAKSVIQKVADKVEEKIQKEVEKEERKEVQKREIKEEEPIEEERIDPVGSNSDETVKEEIVTKEEEVKEKEQEIITLDKNKSNETEPQVKQDDVDGIKKSEVVEPTCTQKTVKPLGSTENKPKPESLPIESSNENNLSGHTIENTDSKPKPENEEETQPILINEGPNSQASEEVTPEETESFADIAQKIPFADDNSEDVIEDVGKAPIVDDDETKVEGLNTIDHDKEDNKQKEDTQIQTTDSENTADIAQEAEAEAEPCIEEVQEPVEAIIDDVEIDVVSDNMDTGSEQSTTSDTNDTNEMKKKSSVNRLFILAFIIALFALLIALLSFDLTVISKAIGLTKPEPKPIVKPFWKFF